MLVTRQDMAAILYRTAKYKGIPLPDGSDNSFADSDEIAQYALEAVNSLAEAHVINGMDTDHFAPNGYATRAQAAKMVYELLEL